MKINYHGGTYEIDEQIAPRVQRWLAAQELPVRVWRKIAAGKPLPGNRNLVYPDDTVRDGYCICPADTDIRVGAEIKVGTGYLNNGSIGTVTGIGESYDMAEDSTVTDEDHSYSGQRVVGHTLVSVRRVYFAMAT